MKGWRGWREAAAWVLAGLLLWSLWSSVPLLEWNVHVWNRLRAANRTSPDDDLDRSFAGLRTSLPARDVIGFHFSGAPDNGRMLYRLRYSLAPLRIHASIEPEFVVEAGPASEAGSLTHNRAFLLVRDTGDDLRVMRRAGK